MPVRSKCLMLPPKVRAWLDAELRRRHFSGFVELEQALAAKGYKVSKSAIHKYSLTLKTTPHEGRLVNGWDGEPIHRNAPHSTPRPKVKDQRAAVREWLLAGHSLTQAEAVDRFGVWRLAAIIERIRRRDGLPILTTRCGESGYARYRLPPDHHPEVLRRE